MIRIHAMKQIRHLQANSPSVRITENLLGRLQITIGFRAWKQDKKSHFIFLVKGLVNVVSQKVVF